MAQSGLHGIIGLYVGRALAGSGAPPGTGTSAGSGALAGGGAASAREREKGDLKFGFVLGNILPDVDLLPLVLLYLYDSKLAMSMHRTFTHSLLMAAAVYLVFAARRRPGLALGLAAGMVLHDLVDVAVWFSGVDLLWPLGLLGVPSAVNLWANLHIPGVWAASWAPPITWPMGSTLSCWAGQPSGGRPASLSCHASACTPVCSGC